MDICGVQNLFVVAKMETQVPYQFCEERDVSRTTGRRSSPEASGASHTLRPEAHQRPFVLSTWLDEKEHGNFTMCRMGAAFFTNAEELKKHTGIDVTRYLNFVTGEGRRFAGTLSVECR